MAAPRRPKDEIEELFLHNKKDDDGSWVGCAFRKGAWVYLQPAAVGPHRVRQRNVMEHHWKGRLESFKKASNGELVAVVQHVYAPRDIHLRQQTRFPSNYIFPSNLVEEQPLRSLTGTFQALHVDIGEAMFPGKQGTKLLKEQIFFYQYSYVVPKDSGGYGKLSLITPPPLTAIEWPIPDAFTVMIMKTKMVSDIQGSLKFAKPSRSVGLGWVCPIHVFAKMFNQFTFSQAPTMYVCKKVLGDNMVSLLGDNWSVVEGVHKNDMYKCSIVETTVAFRFLKARSTLSMRFYYERWMRKGNCWVQMQADEEEIMPYDTCVYLPSGNMDTVSVSKHWTLLHLREHLNVVGGEDLSKAQFKVNNRKIGKRIESNTLLDPNWDVVFLSIN